MDGNRSSTGNLIDPSLARGFARSMLHESERRETASSHRVRGTPFNLVGRKRIIESLVKGTPNLIGSVTVPDRTNAVIASFSTVSSETRAQGLIFTQFEFELDPKRMRREGPTALYSQTQLVAIAMPHVLERMVMRLGHRRLDDIIPVLRPSLGWAVMARYMGRCGPFSVPIPEGLVCCEWYRNIDMGGGVRLGPGAIIKTFISTENMKSRTQSRRDALIAAGAMDMSPRFPRLTTPRPEETDVFAKMHAIEAEYQRDVQDREARRQRDPSAA